MDYKRRADDKRLERVEDKMIELYAKVTNGITDRGIRTEQLVELINERQDKFEQRFTEHLATEELESYILQSTLDTMSKGINKIDDRNSKWSKGLLYAAGGIGTSLVALIGWLLTHAELIKHLTEGL